MKRKRVINILIIMASIIIVLFIGLVFFIVFKDLKQEALLKQEIVNYSNKDLAMDDFSINVKTTGDCAYVEEAVKKYYKKLSDNVKSINIYLNNENISNILSVKSLVNDRPDFTMSHNTIKITRNKINSAIKNIDNLCDKKTIKNLIDKSKLDDSDYYYDLYLQFMYTDKDLEDFADIQREMSLLSKNLNSYLDKIDEILVFLQNNDVNIQYGDIIYFNSDKLLVEYKRLISDLSNISNNIGVDNSLDNKNDDIMDNM